MSAENKISLCMIVKDEEAWIGECLDSVKGLVSEMIIVDTGSKDKTVQIAKEKGAQVHNFEWINDFAAARNFSITKASCSWILVLDADERIDKKDFDKIKLLTADTSKCYLLTQRHYTNDHRLSNYVPCQKEHPQWEKEYAGYFESSLARLFPKNEEVKYSGYVHELIEYSIKENSRYSLVHSGIIIHHYGHTPEVAAKKDKRKLYSGLGEAKLSDKENAWKNYFEIGIEYNINGKLEESEKALSKSAELNPFYVDTWVNLGYVQCELELYKKAEQSLKNALKINPRAAHAYCNLGVVYLRCAQLPLSEKCFTNAIILDPKYVNAYCNLGKVLVNMQRLSEAVHFYNKALDLMPNCHTAINDLNIIYSSIPKGPASANRHNESA